MTLAFSFGLLLLMAGLTSILAKQPTIPHGTAEPLKVAPETRTYMKKMESDYLRLQVLSNMDEVDYKEIQRALDRMEKTSKKIRRLNTNLKLNESLKGLREQIEEVENASRRHNREQVKMGLGILHTTCFGCHSEHARPL